MVKFRLQKAQLALELAAAVVGAIPWGNWGMDGVEAAKETGEASKQAAAKEVKEAVHAEAQKTSFHFEGFFSVLFMFSRTGGRSFEPGLFDAICLGWRGRSRSACIRDRTKGTACESGKHDHYNNDHNHSGSPSFLGSPRVISNPGRAVAVLLLVLDRGF